MAITARANVVRARLSVQDKRTGAVVASLPWDVQRADMVIEVPPFEVPAGETLVVRLGERPIYTASDARFLLAIPEQDGLLMWPLDLPDPTVEDAEADPEPEGLTRTVRCPGNWIPDWSWSAESVPAVALRNPLAAGVRVRLLFGRNCDSPFVLYPATLVYDEMGI